MDLRAQLDEIRKNNTAGNAYTGSYAMSTDAEELQARFNKNKWANREQKYLDLVKTKQSPDLHDYRDLTEYALQNPIGLTADQVVSSAVQNGWFDALSTSLGENIVHKEKVDDSWKNELKTAAAKARYLNALADKNGGELPENFSIESLSGKTADDFSNMMKLQGLNPDTKMSFDDMVLARYEQKRKAAEYGMDDFGKSSAAVISAVPAGVENFGKGIVSAIEGTVNQVGGNGDKVLTEEEIKRRQARDAALYPALSAYSRIYKPNVADVPLGNALSDLTFAGANMVPSIAMNAVLPGSGLWATGISSGGNSYDQALSEGKTQNQAFGYGLVSGVLESTTQKLLGGIQGLGSSAISKLGSKLPSNILGKVGAAFKKAANTKIGSYFLDNLSEGSEEWLQANLDPIVRNVLLDENNEIKPFSEDKLYAGLLGFFNAAVLNAPGLFTGRNSTVTDQNIPDPLIQDMLDNRAAIAEAMQQGIVQDTNAEKLGETGQIPAVSKGVAGNSTTSQAKYSIRTDASGNQYVNVDTDQNIFEGLQPSEINKMAKMYIKEYLLGSTPLGDTDTSVIDSKSASKYTNPGKRQAHFNEKMKTSPELKNLLSIATKVSESDAVKTNSTYPKYEYYSADFEIDGQRFNGLINIGVDENGVKHFYDINKIHLINGISQDANRGIDKMYSDPTIPQETAGVNTNISENGENDTAEPIRVSEAEVEALAEAAEKLRIKVKIAELKNNANGMYKDGTIIIDPRTAQPVIQVFKHELTHYLEGTGGYSDLELYVIRQLKKIHGEEYVSTLVSETVSRYADNGFDITREEARREIVADFVGEHLFTDEGAIYSLVRENRSFGKRILDWIRYKIKQFAADSPNVRFLNKAERLYQKAIDQARSGKRQSNTNSQAKHSINPDFDAQYDQWNKKDNRGYFKVGTTSKALESIGINPSEIYWDKAKIIKIQKAHPDMTDEVIKQVPQLLENPMLIMQSQTAVNRIVVLGEVYADGKPVLCALELKPNGNIDNFIKIASAYPKNPLQNLVNTSDILYVNPDKNRTDSWLKAIRLQLPSGLTNYGSIHNVTYVDKNVKGNVTFGEAPAKTAMQAAFEKAGYNTNISKSEGKSTKGEKLSLPSTEPDPKYIQEYEDKLAVKNQNAVSPEDNPEVHKLLNDPDNPIEDAEKAEFKKEYALRLKNARFTGTKDFWRVMDSFSGRDAKLREYLNEKIVNPLTKAKSEYAFSTRDTVRKFKADMNKFGIKLGSKESAAIMWIGEGKRQVGEVKNKDGFIEAKTMPYTMDMLKKDFPDSWENILGAEKAIRELYDDYLVRINSMLKKVYPNAGKYELEKLDNKRIAFANLEKKLHVYWNLKSNVKDSISRKQAELSKKKPDTLIYATLQNQINNLKSKLDRIDQKTKEVQEKKKIAKEELDEQQRLIDRGEHLKNKRLTPRKDYFFHMQELETGFSAFKNIIGGNFEIDPALAAVSEQTKPKSRWTAFMQRRGNGKYQEDAVAGVLEYIKLAEAKIAIDPVAAQYRGIVDEVTNHTKYSKNANSFIDFMTQYTNALLGKSNRLDRIFQNEVGRKTMKVIAWITNRTKANAVVGNVSSAISQFFNYQNVAGYVKNPADLAVGSMQHLKYFADSLLRRKSLPDSKTARLLESSPFLTERYLDNEFEVFDKRKLSSVKKFTSAMLEFGDKWVAQSAWLAAHHQGTRKGVHDPVSYADDLVRKAIGGRGIGELPLHQQSVLVKTFAPFTVEVWNSWNTLAEQTKNKDFAGIIITMMIAFLMNGMTKKLFGKTPSSDPIGAAADAIKEASDPENDKNLFEKSLAVTGRVSGELLQNMPYANFILPFIVSDETGREALFGENDPSRYGTGNIGLTTITKPLVDLAKGNDVSLLEPILKIVLPGGGSQIYRTYSAAVDMGLPYIKANKEDGISVDKRKSPSAVTDKGKYKFAIDTSDPFDIATALLLGSYATKGGKEYLNNGATPLSEAATEKLYAAQEEGTLTSAQFMQYYAFKQTAKSDKTPGGKTIPGSLKEKKIKYLMQAFGFSRAEANKLYEFL